MPFLLFPLIVMVLAILLNAQGTPTIAANGGTVFCSNPAQTNCINGNSPGISYFCQQAIISPVQSCKILPSCNAPPYPAPLWCVGDAITALNAGCLVQFLLSGASGCGVYLPEGASVFVPTAQIASSISANGALFSFAAGGTSGFIAMIGVVVGVMCLAGLTVFSTGLQGESLHILFMGGMFMGLWLILTGVEGYPGTASELFFNSLNAAIAGLGTFMYVMMTLSMILGFVGMVGRGT